MQGSPTSVGRFAPFYRLLTHCSPFDVLKMCRQHQENVFFFLRSGLQCVCSFNIGVYNPEQRLQTVISM